MNGIHSSKIKGLVGFLLIIIAISLIFYWENFGREQLLYKEVIIAKQDIYCNDRITKDNSIIIKMEDSTIPKGAISRLSEIMGKEAKQFIPQNAIVDHRYLTNKGMTLSKNQFIFRIPNDWIKGYPGSLRRGDDIYLYPVKKRDSLGAEPTAIEIEFVSLIALKVAYVKDSGNREVINVENQKLERLDATSNVHSIEVMVTKNQVTKLQELYDRGYQFLIMYQ